VIVVRSGSTSQVVDASNRRRRLAVLRREARDVSLHDLGVSDEPTTHRRVSAVVAYRGATESAHRTLPGTTDGAAAASGEQAG